jgi:hypothetical protein
MSMALRKQTSASLEAWGERKLKNDLFMQIQAAVISAK